jgi:hypothetical protein
MPMTDDRMATRISTCDRELHAALATHLDLSQGVATDADRPRVQMTPWMPPDRLRRLTPDALARRATCTSLKITHISRAITASV